MPTCLLVRNHKSEAPSEESLERFCERFGSEINKQYTANDIFTL
jgi:hypothetical protein